MVVVVGEGMPMVVEGKMGAVDGCGIGHVG